MNAPSEMLYTRDHEWVSLDQAAGEARMGITDFAQDALGEVVFVQMAAVGTLVQEGLSCGEVESSKSVSDIYAPVTGVIKKVNEELTSSPQRVNEDPYGRGWLCVIELTADAELDHLIDSDAYKSLVEG